MLLVKIKCYFNQKKARNKGNFVANFLFCFHPFSPSIRDPIASTGPSAYPANSASMALVLRPYSR